MKDDFKKQKWNVAAGANAASYLEMLLRDEFDEKMESFINLHPILKMYFDSDLSSEIENNAFLAISDAVINTIEELTKEGILSNFHDIGIATAHIVCKRLYLLKLIYHANKGWISREKFCELSAEHLAIETATLLNQLWDILPASLEIGSTWLLTTCGMDPITAKQTADKINAAIMMFHPFVKKFITKEKIEVLFKNVIEFTLNSARQVITYAEKMVNKCKSWGRSLCERFRWKIPAFLEEHPKAIVLNDPNNELIISKGNPFSQKTINITINKPDVEIEK